MLEVCCGLLLVGYGRSRILTLDLPAQRESCMPPDKCSNMSLSMVQENMCKDKPILYAYPINQYLIMTGIS